MPPRTELEDLKVNLDQQFKLIITFWIIFMQCGFALLEAGSVRSKNTTNILFKNLLDVFVGALSYWVFGYPFAYGRPGNAFIGHNYFFSTFVKFPQDFPENDTGTSDMNLEFANAENYYAAWMFQFAFAATASTIVSGAMAERTQFAAYLIYSFIITGYVYPLVSHWCWSPDGWLKTGAGLGVEFVDFAGSGVVHVTGGTAALVGAKLLGPRLGRFTSTTTSNEIDSDTQLRGHSVPLACMGGFILFSGFLAFNGGSQEHISVPGDGLFMSSSVMNTMLAGSAGSLSSMIFNILFDHFTGKHSYWSLLVAINGGLAGMVSSCAGSNDMYPWSSVVLGMIAGVSMVLVDNLLSRFKIDDPIGAVPVHLCGGLTGSLLTPIFAIRGQKVNGQYVGGMIYGGHIKSFESFGWNLLGTIVIITWTALCSFVMFFTLRLVGLLRVTEQEEIVGLDIKKHGEPAYPETYHLITDSTGQEPTYSIQNVNRSSYVMGAYSEREITYTIDTPESRT